MKTIILQHWDKEPNELGRLSIANLKSYAKSIDAHYQFIQGYPFRTHLSAPCQKLIMLGECFDTYDYVAMFDMDMFIANKYTGNIFEDTDGIGLHDHITDVVYQRFKKANPKFAIDGYPYWGGCFWRLDRDIRKLFRQYINERELEIFSNNFEDEAIMHRLAYHAGFKELRYMGSEWSMGSYFDNVDQANIIHIRPRESFNGPKITKMEAYKRLNERGLIV